MPAEPQLTDTERLKRYRRFVESLEAHTNSYDDFCDCDVESGDHRDGCMTLLWRMDARRLEQ